ncbi:MAG: helix-turn-helix domain-containing protein [Candidatus Lutacidiplasmatales archaeon]
MAQGMTAPEASRMLGDTPRTVLYWVRRFGEEGLSGLAEEDRPGRPRKLPETQMLAVEAALESPPRRPGSPGPSAMARLSPPTSSAISR